MPGSAGPDLRLARVVVGSDGEAQARPDFRREQVRAVRLVRDQKAAVERSSRADAVWSAAAVLQDVGSAEAITVRSDFLFFLSHFGLRVEERDKRNRVSFRQRLGASNGVTCRWYSFRSSRAVGRIETRRETRALARGPVA